MGTSASAHNPRNPMRRPSAAIVAASVTSFAFVVGLSAQGARSRSDAPAAAQGRNYVVIGCVSAAPARGGGQAASRFTITDTRGTPATYRLDGEPAQLRTHVGHTVEVEGPIAATASGPAGRPAIRTLTVKALRYLSPSCSK